MNGFLIVVKAWDVELMVTNSHLNFYNYFSQLVVQKFHILMKKK